MPATSLPGFDFGEAVRRLRVAGRDPRRRSAACSSSEPWSSTGVIASFEMNVNSDDDAQTRATSSTADRVREDPAALAAVLLGEREPGEPGVAPRLPARPRDTPRARRPRRRSARCAPRRAGARTPAAPRTRPTSSNAAHRHGTATSSAGGAAPGTAASRDLAAPLVDGRADLAGRLAQAAASGTARRSRAGAGSTVAGFVHEQLARAGELGIGAAVVAEQLHRGVDVVDHRRAPEQRGALARDLGDHRDDVVDVLVLGRARSRSATRSASVYAYPTFGPGRAEQARPAARRGRGRPAARPASGGAGGSAVPGGRFCCWRGRSAGSAGTNGSVGTRRTLRRDAVGDPLDAVARAASPNWIESSSACHDASMMFSLTPIVVHVASPSVESISTRVTAPVPLFVSSTRTL